MVVDKIHGECYHRDAMMVDAKKCFGGGLAIGSEARRDDGEILLAMAFQQQNKNTVVGSADGCSRMRLLSPYPV